MLPIIEVEAIERAVVEFNERLRPRPEWRGWEQRASQKYALEIEGILYPPKQIVSMATGEPVSNFTGGAVTNSFLVGLGFKVVPLNTLSIERPSLAIPSFEVGRLYSRAKEITGRFGGSSQSGIAPSSKSPVVFLFTGGSGAQYGYKDSYDDEGCLNYTGEGQEGNMTLTRGNLAISTHAIDGRALHVFETTGKGKSCIYRGEFVYVSPSFERGIDRTGNERNIIIFRLMPVAATLVIELGNDPLQEDPIDPQNQSGPPNLKVLRDMAIAACSPQKPVTNPKDVVRITYERSMRVKRYVLARARGYCELCEEPAPFLRKSDKTPYLEPHHINRLSDGGLDHPLYVGAVCPTCHRRIHSGLDGTVRNEKLREKIEMIESEICGAGERLL